MDPRHWNAAMKATVDTGLGTGSRDRDMSMLDGVLQKQIMIMDRLVGSGFSDLALEMLPKIQRTLVKQAESAGLKNPEEYYPEVTEDLLIKMKAQAAKQGAENPEAKKHQQEMQMKQQEINGKLALDRMEMELDADIDRDKFNAEMALKREQLIAEMNLKAEMARMGQATGGNASQPVRIGGDPG